jgi:hypothetical protein
MHSTCLATSCCETPKQIRGPQRYLHVAAHPITKQQNTQQHQPPNTYHTHCSCSATEKSCQNSALHTTLTHLSQRRPQLMQLLSHAVITAVPLQQIRCLPHTKHAGRQQVPLLLLHCCATAANASRTAFSAFAVSCLLDAMPVSTCRHQSRAHVQWGQRRDRVDKAMLSTPQMVQPCKGNI